ncbi:hypothetical protein Droror1_Dr00018589 [Drosera rotundifolia]
MYKPPSPQSSRLIAILLLLVSSDATLTTATERGTPGENPFTPKAYLIRYWNSKIYKVPHSDFLLSKASPLTAADASVFASLAATNTLSAHLSSFCKSANLLCLPDPASSLEKHDKDVDFTTYDYNTVENFTNYGTDKASGKDSFKLYSLAENGIVNTFRRYGRDSSGHDDSFAQYSFSNVETDLFNTYGTGAKGGNDEFKHYADSSNDPTLAFTSYSDASNNRDQGFAHYGDNGNGGAANFASYGKNGKIADNTFTSYGNDTNVLSDGFKGYSEGGSGSGKFTSYSQNGNDPTNTFSNYGADQGFAHYGDNGNGGAANFASYGKNGKSADNTFTSYGNETNVLSDGFKGYSEGGSGSDKFTSYSQNGNVPTNTFSNYGAAGKGVVETFKGYRNESNVGDDSFTSYAKKSNAEEVTFTNYGLSFNQGTDNFTGYGQDASNVKKIGFTTYGSVGNTTFADYAKKETVSFAKYNVSSNSDATATTNGVSGSKMVNRWVEPGKFFREDKLQSGVVMPMPDIKDKMPVRSFLPRSIVSKIPFTSSKEAEIKQIFHGFDNSSMESMIHSALAECERAPSRGEKKRCIGSAEDMIDFAVSVLGRSAELRTTENVNGAKGNILIGNVKGINGGKVTHSVSCHQSLYPYLLYYCHSVPKVRVYEADILDPTSKAKINHGVAICHLDTSDWSPTHGAFLALGSAPGKIEVCHWIFENDLTWTIAD